MAFETLSHSRDKLYYVENSDKHREEDELLLEIADDVDTGIDIRRDDLLASFGILDDLIFLFLSIARFL
jgi:hypothetical protein